jgi:hypothetical protein
MTVGVDPFEGAVLGMEVFVEADIELRLTTHVLAKVEALLASTIIERAEFHKINRR